MRGAGLYPKLAAEGMRKNRRLYLPYLLTCVCMVMMSYILGFLAHDETLRQMEGGDTLTLILNMGSGVVIFFSLLFLFYTNSFLIRRRYKEFGLYNVLGMGKRELARIISWETLFSALISLAVGLFFGMALSKLAELGLARLLGVDVGYALHVDVSALGFTLVAYAVIFALIWLAGLIRIRRSSAVSLMKSENVGEKPPKANWLLGLGGVVLLAAAYWLAVTVKDPLEALVWFFGAVLLVILATYLIMIAGSVLLCRILQKNRRYYYKPQHFISVSSMVYRMKRNGAGLASICVLATMVLVMLSSTTCLYVGAEDALHSRYPRDFVINVTTLEDISEEKATTLRTLLNETADKLDAQPYNEMSYRELCANGQLSDDGCLTLDDGLDYYAVVNATQVSVIPLSDYNTLTGTSLTLDSGEAYYYSAKNSYDCERFYLDNGPSWRVVGRLDSLWSDDTNLQSSIYFIVSDFDETTPRIMELSGGDGSSVQLCYDYGFDTDLPEKLQSLNNTQATAEEREGTLYAALWEALGQACNEGLVYGYGISALADGRSFFYSTFGGLFFIGIILSVVFIFAAVLILYYKQISEGYEDRARYDIMRKVGMTKEDIRRSINSQLLTVFYLPLVLAGLHMAFAFPMIRKLLELFVIYNSRLLAVTTLVSFAVFALLYALVYRITSNAYYNIVSTADEAGS